MPKLGKSDENDAAEELNTFDLKLDYSTIVPRFVVSREGVVKLDGIFSSDGFVDDKELHILLPLDDALPPQTYKDQGEKTLYLKYQRRLSTDDRNVSDTLERSSDTESVSPSRNLQRSSPASPTPWAGSAWQAKGDPASQELAALQSEYRQLKEAYYQAVTEPADKTKPTRVRKVMDPREIMPAKYLAFEEQHRGTDVGLKTLIEAAKP